MFQKIYKLGYRRAFFETGLTFLNAIIKYKLLNNLYIFQNNKKLRQNGFNNNHIKYLKRIKLNKEIKVNLKTDRLYQVEF